MVEFILFAFFALGFMLHDPICHTVQRIYRRIRKARKK